MGEICQPIQLCSRRVQLITCPHRTCCHLFQCIQTFLSMTTLKHSNYGVAHTQQPPLCPQYTHTLKLTLYVLSFGIIMMHGISLSIMAKGPCFNSPLKIPSECMYVSSLIFWKSTNQQVNRNALTMGTASNMTESGQASLQTFLRCLRPRG